MHAYIHPSIHPYIIHPSIHPSGYLLVFRRFDEGNLAEHFKIRVRGGHNWVAQRKVLHKKLRKVLIRYSGESTQWRGRLYKVIGNRKKVLWMFVELQQYF